MGRGAIIVVKNCITVDNLQLKEYMEKMISLKLATKERNKRNLIVTLSSHKYLPSLPVNCTK